MTFGETKQSQHWTKPTYATKQAQF